MKILIIGHGRHGKDTVAEMLQQRIGLAFQSSSWAAAEKAVYPTLSKQYGYMNVQECFDDRANHRMEWRELITGYNTPDKARLCREILQTSDGYVGMRHHEEFAASRHLFDVVLWVDASERLPPDPSMSIQQDDDMWIVPNNGRLWELAERVDAIADALVDCFK